DKGLSADILRVANSAYYGRSGKIKTLKDAITLLGLKLIKNIAIVQTKRAMHKNLGKDPVFKKVLIEKQILTSLIAFDISTPLGLKNLRDQVFTPANFLNAGMTIFALNRTEEYKKLLELHLAKKVEITEIESKAYGLSSKDIGLYVFKIWNMPEPIIDVMKNHGFKLDQLETVSDLDRLVRLGDILSRKMMELPVFEEEEEILKKIFEKYGAGEELLEAFGEDYFDMIQSHPFFEMLAF
ncbi:MAG: HDOD domain-containing protein, partial [Leptospiraceae bacterium]|nr:HDOD domain-containing protein [Leptospiraceae bacterium]